MLHKQEFRISVVRLHVTSLILPLAWRLSARACGCSRKAGELCRAWPLPCSCRPTRNAPYWSVLMRTGCGSSLHGQQCGFGVVFLSICLECFSENFPQSPASRSVPSGEVGRGWRESESSGFSNQSLYLGSIHTIAAHTWLSWPLRCDLRCLCQLR